MHSYTRPASTLHHADMYRLDQLAEVADLALLELAEYDGIVLVEWGDVVESTFGEHVDRAASSSIDGDPTPGGSTISRRRAGRGRARWADARRRHVALAVPRC